MSCASSQHFPRLHCLRFKTHTLQTSLVYEIQTFIYFLLGHKNLTLIILLLSGSTDQNQPLLCNNALYYLSTQHILTSFEEMTSKYEQLVTILTIHAVRLCGQERVQW